MELTITNGSLVSKPRHTTLHGVKYLVVPTVLLTTGVHEGTQGAVLYNEALLNSADVHAWNSKPVVVDHPQGKSLASESDVLERSQVGFVLNARYKKDKGDKKGRIVGDVWLNKERASLLIPEVMEALANGKSVEVSTGILTRVDNESGEDGGEKYKGVVVKMIPDHLAILPNDRGACSVNDGCGLLKNELSHSELYFKLSEACRNTYGNNIYLTDVFESFAIYSLGPSYFMVTYSRNDDGDVTLSGVPVQVERLVKYRTQDGTIVNKESDVATNAPTTTEVTNNCACGGTPQSPEPNKTTTPVVNNEAASASPSKPQTVEEYIANAPPAIRETLQAGIAELADRKRNLAASILQNKANRFTEDQLRSKSVEELQAIAALAGSVSEPTPTMNYAGQGSVRGSAEPVKITAPPLPSMFAVSK